MDFIIKKDIPKLYVAFSGDIGFGEANKVRAAFHEIQFMKDVKHTIFDFSNVNTCTSNVIGLLLQYYRKSYILNYDMEIKGISDNLYNQFLDIHLDRVFPISR